MPTNDEQFYETVSQEMKSSNVQEGMWMKAFEQAMGDEKKATALYIKMRVDQLKREAREAEMNALGADPQTFAGEADGDDDDDDGLMAVKKMAGGIPEPVLNALQIGGFVIGCVLIWIFRQELMGLGRSLRSMLQGG